MNDSRQMFTTELFSAVGCLLNIKYSASQEAVKIFNIMITLEVCNKILRENGLKIHSQDAIKELRDYLYLLASFQIEALNNNPKSN